MRLIGAAAIAFVLALTFSSASAVKATIDASMVVRSFASTLSVTSNCGRTSCGCTTRFRRSVRQPRCRVGLKVDVDALPPAIVEALRADDVDLDDPAVTIALLRLNAVVGVMGKVDDAGRLTSIGVTCALCHSTWTTRS